MELVILICQWRKLTNEFSLVITVSSAAVCLFKVMFSITHRDKCFPRVASFTNIIHVKRAAIHLLMSMLPLPLHYDDMLIEV